MRKAVRAGAWPRVVASVLFGACSDGSRTPQTAGPNSQVIHRSVGAEPTSLDPQRAGDTFSYEVLRDIFEGLTTESPSGDIVPGSAKEWTVSDRGTRYTFRLRPLLKWSNGAPLTAVDFVQGIQRAVSPEVASPNAQLLGLIRRSAIADRDQPKNSPLAVAAPSPDTVQIDLIAPAPYFPAVLANAIAYPTHRGNPEYADRSRPSPVSNGAYRVARITPGGAIELDRNPYYWDASHVAIPAVQFVAIADSSNELLRYRAGQLDLTASVPLAQLDSLRRDSPGELQMRAQLAVIYYAFNWDSTAFKEAPVLREALSLAVDRERLVSVVLRGGQVPAYGFVPPGIAGYDNSAYSWREAAIGERVERAKRLYRASGFGPAKELRLRLLCPDDDTLRQVALAIAAMWREALGVETQLNFLEYRAFLAAREQRGDWDVISHGWNADYPDPANFLSIFASDSPQNDGRIEDADFDRALAEAAIEADAGHRLELLARAERRLLGEYGVAPLYFPVTRRLVKPRVHGAVLTPMNHNYSKYLSLD